MKCGEDLGRCLECCEGVSCKEVSPYLIQINQLMTDSPSLLARKSTGERVSGMGRRASQFQASPFSWEESEGRGGYPGLQPQLQERKIFGFEIYIDNDILHQIGSIEEWFSNLQSSNGLEHIGFNTDLTIPDLNGKNIQIYDQEMEKKYQCAKSMLSDVYQSFKKIKRQAFSVIIFVPQGMVSLLIGAKGHQINKIMKESHTTIVVNQPINRMVYRTAKIQGYHSDIAKACRIIYEMLQQKSSIAYSIEKQPSQLDYTKSKIKSKFIFTDQLVSYIERKKKRLLQRVQQQTKCSVKFEVDRDSRFLKKDEEVCAMSGRLQDVQAMVVMLINICHDYLSQDKRNLDYTLKMLIPANYVTKLIGQKGYMIRDIIDRSGGAMIKILSDKQEKDRQCIISINGSKENKIDAICFIMEQIQCFKNGGPILQSGRSINQNLAQQFKNSLPLHDEEDKKPGDKQTFDPNCTNVSQVTQSPSKPKENGDGSDEQGLIEGEQDEKERQQRQEKERQRQERAEREKRLAIERDLQRINPMRKQREYSRKSQSDSGSRSRSRSKSKKKSKKMQLSRRGHSESESIEYKHDKDAVQVKLVVPRRLGQDMKQLRYIQTLCKSSIVVCEQKLQSGEVVIAIRGNLKDNSRCLQLLQKRLVRFKSTASSAR